MRAPVDRARAIAAAGGCDEALTRGAIPHLCEISLSEAVVLALLKQGVRTYFAIFGHGSTDLAEILRIYQEAGVTRTFAFRNEVAMSHAATALAWIYRETPAVVTSIGPGALQALAGSLAAASNGIGVYHLYGDETTWGEGYNMQQIPKPEQSLYGRLTALMGESFVLHTPQALRDAMRRGTSRVHHPTKAGPFYLLLPINTQPMASLVNLAALPGRRPATIATTNDPRLLGQAAAAIERHNRIVIKAGGGTRGHAAATRRLAKEVGGAVVTSPGSVGVMPDDHPAESARWRIERFYLRQLGDGRGRPCHRRWIALGMPSRLLRHRVPKGPHGRQHQRRCR